MPLGASSLCPTSQDGSRDHLQLQEGLVSGYLASRSSDKAQVIPGPEAISCGANQGSRGKNKEGLATGMAPNSSCDRQSPHNDVSRLL